MTWSRLDNDRWANSKIIEVGLAASGLDTHAICYSASYLTDGFISKSVLTSISHGEKTAPLVAKLVSAGRWTYDEAKAGYWLVNYLEHQPAKQEVLATEKARSESAKKAVTARWDKNREAKSHTEPIRNAYASDTPAYNGRNTEGILQHLTEQNLKELKKIDTEKVEVRSSESEPQEPKAAPKPKRITTRSRGFTEAPEHFEITEPMKLWAVEKVPSLDTAFQTEKFLNHHRSKENIFKNWDAAWRTWMLKASEFSTSAPQNGARGRTTGSSAASEVLEQTMSQNDSQIGMVANEHYAL